MGPWPRRPARDVLARLTALDLTPPRSRIWAPSGAGDQHPDLLLGSASSASWAEMHFPADCGEVWDALLEAGAEFGIRPFGVNSGCSGWRRRTSSSRTPTLTSVLDADMAWACKLDKGGLRRAGGGLRSGRRVRQRLIGFGCRTARLPAGVTSRGPAGPPVGRVTSALEPTRARHRLALLPVEDRLTRKTTPIRSDGGRCTPGSSRRRSSTGHRLRGVTGDTPSAIPRSTIACSPPARAADGPVGAGHSFGDDQ
jgi:sarcosine oxidase subunit alpha